MNKKKIIYGEWTDWNYEDIEKEITREEAQKIVNEWLKEINKPHTLDLKFNISIFNDYTKISFKIGKGQGYYLKIY
jgi:hypothetical protein